MAQSNIGQKLGTMVPSSHDLCTRQTIGDTRHATMAEWHHISLLAEMVLYLHPHRSFPSLPLQSTRPCPYLYLVWLHTNTSVAWLTAWSILLYCRCYEVRRRRIAARAMAHFMHKALFAAWCKWEEEVIWEGKDAICRTCHRVGGRQVCFLCGRFL